MDAMWPPSLPTSTCSDPVIWIICGHLRAPCRRDVGVNSCECMLYLHDCPPSRTSAEPSSQLCGNLCSATALLHVQPSGRMLSLRHVRSKSGEGCSLGLGWAWRMPFPNSIFDGGESMCSAPKAVNREHWMATAFELRAFVCVLTTT